MRTDDLVKFIRERQRILLKKLSGAPWPWTEDPILRDYRFCNVHREDDRVTKWIAQNWRDPNAGVPDLWFAMVVARLFNQPEALAAIGFPIPWQPIPMMRTLHKRANAGQRNFNAAYIVSTNGRAMDKVEYVMDCVLAPLWAARKQLRPVEGSTLAEWHALLMQQQGLGSFMAAQVVADMKYVDPLLKALDWNTWAASGPGSRRGLNRVYDLPVEQRMPEAEWLDRLQTLHAAARKKLGAMALHAQDLQNCLCEFDKYERARLGEGRPKQLYTPGG